jgi:hypothetical protein
LPTSSSDAAFWAIGAGVAQHGDLFVRAFVFASEAGFLRSVCVLAFPPTQLEYVLLSVIQYHFRGAVSTCQKVQFLQGVQFSSQRPLSCTLFGCGYHFSKSGFLQIVQL